MTPTRRELRSAVCCRLGAQGFAAVAKMLRLAGGRIEAERHPHEVRNGAGLHFVHDGGPMVFGRPGVIPNWRAISFVGRPCTSNAKTSCSRWVSNARRALNSWTWVWRSRTCSVLPNASSTVSSSASGSSGFSTKWNAPHFIAVTAVGTSPCPLIRMTAVSQSSAAAIRLSKPMPLRPGSWLSRMTQLDSSSGTDAR